MKKQIFFLLILLIGIVGVVNADTLLVYPDADGYVEEGTNQVFYAMRNDVGDTSNTALTYTTNNIFTTSTSGQWDALRRSYFIFNTSSIGSGSTITSAILKTTGVNKGNTYAETPTMVLTGGTSTSGTIAATDYSKVLNTDLAARITYANWSTTGNNNFTLTDYTTINKTGFTPLYLRQSFDVDNTSPTWGNVVTSYFVMSSVEATLASRPYLLITYTPAAGATAPVASFTCTKNFLRFPISITCTDSSTNTPTSWSWNMGDGSASKTTQNVTYQYPKRGSWGITLNATNAGGSNVTPAATNVKVVGYENT